jgi:hypothetical protein
MFNKSNISKLFFVLILSLFCILSQAKVVASITGDSGDAILLKDDVCENTPFHKFEIQNGEATVMKSGCWFVHGETVILMLSEGSVGLAPITAFKPVNSKNAWDKNS